MTENSPNTPNLAGMHLLSHATEATPTQQPKLSEQIPRSYHDDEWNTAREAEGLASVDAGRIPLSAHGISVSIGEPGSFNWFNVSEKQRVIRVSVDGVALSPAIEVERLDAYGVDEDSTWDHVIGVALDYSKGTIYGDPESKAARDKIAEWHKRTDDEYDFRAEAIQDAETKARAGAHARKVSNEDQARIVIELLHVRFPKLADKSAAPEVARERARQDVKWGEQNHPDGTGPDVTPLSIVGNGNVAAEIARFATRETDDHAEAGTVTWLDILREEYHEAIAESDPEKLHRELIQVAAVAQQWAEAIVRRGGKS